MLVNFVSSLPREGPSTMVNLKEKVLWPALEAIQPADLMIVFLFWALAKENGLVSLLARVKRAQKSTPTTAWLRLRKRELSLGRATWRPLRQLMASIWPLFYLLDVLVAVLKNWGLPLPNCAQPAIATIGYSIFAANLLRGLKRVAFATSLIHAFDAAASKRQSAENISDDLFDESSAPQNAAKEEDEDVELERRANFVNQLNTIDRVGDAVVSFVVGGVTLEALSWCCGFKLTSLLAFGGVGSLVVGLACQTPLANIISGVIVAVSNPFQLGDEIGLDGIEGYVDALGWYKTSLRGKDDQIFQIPNSLIAGRTVVNFSRMKYKRFNTHLKLRRQDLSNLEVLVDDLTNRISKLPNVVDNSVRGLSLHVNLASFAEDGQPIISIEAHVKTNDDDYMSHWQQRALLEIRDALDANDCDFAASQATSSTRKIFNNLLGAAFSQDDDNDSKSSSGSSSSSSSSEFESSTPQKKKTAPKKDPEKEN